jgi:uncharacterized protein (TIGR02145 family)
MREQKIGAQIWTLDNLDVVTYRNGDSIQHVEDADEWGHLKTGAWCYLNNDSKNNSVYGKLYNYYAVIDPRGLAPEGYRIPAHFDWLMIQNLGDFLKSKNDLKELLEIDIYPPFNAKPAGYRDSSGRFCFDGEAVGWWASPESDVRNQGNIAHWIYKSVPYLGWKPFSKNDGFYVRCLKVTYKTTEIYFNDNLGGRYKSISLKYSGQTTFQEVLNFIYEEFLKDEVNSFSYGVEWTIQVYDGEHIRNLDKIGNSDDRNFDSILSSQYRETFRLIINLI